MAVRTLPPAELLRQSFDYNPETGELRHKTRPREHFASERGWRIFNTQFAGTVAGCGDEHGYCRVWCDGKQHLAHRLIYKLVHGIEPPPCLDHINLDKTDNRIANLRPATPGQNTMNRLARADNPTGAKGVRYVPRLKKFQARIRANHKEYHLGVFSTLDAAVAAYAKAAARLHGEFASVPRSLPVPRPRGE
jgi:hypothetical protein